MAYITPEDFKNYYGMDLRSMLKINDNESFQAETFIQLVTDHLMTWVDTTTFRNFRWDCLTEYQMYHWKHALLAQTYYTYKEGAKALGLSSGADDEKGKIFDLNFIASVEVCQAAIRSLMAGGIMNMNVKNRRRSTSWLNGGAAGYIISGNSGGQGGGGDTPPQPSPYILVGIGYTEDD